MAWWMGSVAGVSAWVESTSGGGGVARPSTVKPATTSRTRPRLPQPNMRAGVGRAARVGAGAGLPISRSVVVRDGGDAGVTGRPGAGVAAARGAPAATPGGASAGRAGAAGDRRAGAVSTGGAGRTAGTRGNPAGTVSEELGQRGSGRGTPSCQSAGQRGSGPGAGFEPAGFEPAGLEVAGLEPDDGRGQLGGLVKRPLMYPPELLLHHKR